MTSIQPTCVRFGKFSIDDKKHVLPTDWSKELQNWAEQPPYSAMLRLYEEGMGYDVSIKPQDDFKKSGKYLVNLVTHKKHKVVSSLAVPKAELSAEFSISVILEAVDSMLQGILGTNKPQ